MPISESLARGLKERFFAELKQRTMDSLITMLGKKQTATKRKQFDKWANQAEKKLAPSVIGAYHGGSNRNQYFAFEILNFIPDREFNSWMEKSIFGEKVIIHKALTEERVVSSNYGISEHAILRIFQRLDDGQYTSDYSQRKILDELSFVPLWSNFWFLTLSQIKSRILLREISISIPTLNGLFLANYDLETSEIEIRTFIDDNLLSDEQWLIKRSMLSIGKYLNPSSLSFACPKTIYIDQSIPHLFAMLSYLMYSNENFNFILNNSIFKIEDDVARQGIKEELIFTIKNFAKDMTFKEVNFLVSHSPREFSNYCIKNFKTI